MKKLIAFLLIITIQSVFALDSGVTTRVKDISRLLNDRENILIGYGLVVGLQGTGDDNVIMRQGIANMLSNFGVNNLSVDDLESDNTAVVMVTAKLGAFNVPGDNIDIHVSSLGQSSSLRGGMLLFTPLKAANGEVYAIAQGPVAVGGYSVSGKRSSSVKNHTASGTIPNGAIIEKSVKTELAVDGELIWVLDRKDFSTIDNIRLAIIEQNADWEVASLSGSQFSIKLPAEYEGKEIELISLINNLEVESDSEARIVINERTGAVVIGGPVRIAPVVISYQNMNVSVSDSSAVSQPGAFSSGATKVVNDTSISIKQGLSGALEIVDTKENTIEQVVSVLNRIGMEPSDVITILQLMKEAGAIKAKMEII